MSTIIKHTHNGSFDMNKYVGDLCGFIEGKHTMGATLIDACCETPEFSKRCEEETDRLLEPENILQILDIDNEQILLLIACYKGDLLNMAEVVMRYVRGCAENQAYEHIRDEMSR